MGHHQVEVEFKMERVVPYFQPIMNLQSNRVWRYECLARLLGDKEHIFLPSEFLTIVEQKNWNEELTHHIYEQSRRYCFHRNMPWSINLGDSDLNNEALVAWLIHSHQDSTSTLFGIEISQTTLQNNYPVVIHLRDKCPNLAIIVDDVSSASDLLKEALTLNIQAIKLCGSLVNDPSINRSKLAEFVDLCKANDTKLVAEHIEDEATLDLMTSLGVDYGQGFYLSSPSASV
ncbi:MAG: EAL domain-containing protein (putative c-di-GMP-specific phosphodiesterase class I) [Glaciecola sp.]|jgi:EAL domain-containing protein (putative c-di-GMP-specific phosphodiesterase class I)|mmetsp:Transcript_1379/g.5575  ORF Transcript_1379/g.5575 Transcript_1379/m.5575 type:complete len:231 (-) Transcript_1379:133-825(-)